MRGEAAADDVAGLLKAPTALSAANYAEVTDHIMRLGGLDADEAEIRMQLLIETGMQVIPLDTRLARLAGEIRARHHARKTCPVSLADCCALATSQAIESPLATSDPALATVARAEGSEVIALPNSRGIRP